MFLDLAHTKLKIYHFTWELTLECYKITKKFPSDERFALVQQLRSASISVHLNLAEGCSRRTQVERNRFFEIARGSLIEIDSAMDISHELGYVVKEELNYLGNLIIQSFKLLSSMIQR